MALLCTMYLCTFGPALVFLETLIRFLPKIFVFLFFFFLTFQRLVSSKMSGILKQTCSFQMQVCLSMYHLGFFKKRLSCSWFFGVLFSFRGSFAAKIYLFKVNNRNIRKRCGKCSKLTMRTPEWRHWHCSGVFIVNFGHISHLFLMFLLVTLNN